MSQPKIYTPNHLLYWALTLGPLYTCPILPRARTGQQRTAPKPQSLLKLFKLANPKPVYPIPSHRNTINVLAHSSSLPLSLLTSPVAFLCGSPWHGMPLLVRAVRNKLPFQWLSSPDLLALLYLKLSTNMLQFKTLNFLALGFQ